MIHLQNLPQLDNDYDAIRFHRRALTLSLCLRLGNFSEVRSRLANSRRPCVMR